MAPIPLDSSVEANLQMSESAQAMASTDCWNWLVKKMTSNEAIALIRLESYLDDAEHPDREEVMTLCLKWFAVRQQRRRMLKDVAIACNYKVALKQHLEDQLRQFDQFMTPPPPIPDELAEIQENFGGM